MCPFASLTQRNKAITSWDQENVLLHYLPLNPSIFPSIELLVYKEVDWTEVIWEIVLFWVHPKRDSGKGLECR